MSIELCIKNLYMLGKEALRSISLEIEGVTSLRLNGDTV